MTKNTIYWFQIWTTPQQYLEKLHLDSLSMDEHDVGWTAMRDQLHDALGVGMSAEGHVLNEKKSQFNRK